MNQFVPNRPLTIPSNMRFFNSNNDLVSQLYPIVDGSTLPDPTNSFIPFVASQVSLIKDQLVSVNTILSAYNSRISALEVTVSQIQSSGATAIPVVNGGCLNGSIAAPMQNVMALLVTNACNYNTVLGTPTALSLAILAQCANLASADSYSNPGSPMSSLSGWATTPTTVAQMENNQWLAYCDARAGITQALLQSTPKCSDIHINMSGYYDSSIQTIYVSFPNSSYPVGTIDLGASTITVSDSSGHSMITTLTSPNLLSYLNGGLTGVLSLPLTSTISQIETYTVTLYAVLNLANNATVCPNISSWVAGQTISYSLQPLITTNVLYTVSLLDASSGSVVVATVTYTNPTTPQNHTFSALTAGHTYNIRVSVTINGDVTTVCPLISNTV